jgi:hypothetical protein
LNAAFLVVSSTRLVDGVVIPECEFDFGRLAKLGAYRAGELEAPDDVLEVVVGAMGLAIALAECAELYSRSGAAEELPRFLPSLFDGHSVHLGRFSCA